MSERAYAAHAGISRGAVQKARTSGRLVLHADGSINGEASDARRAQATDPSMQRGRHQPSLRPVPEAAVGAVSETLREQGLPAPAARPITSPVCGETTSMAWEADVKIAGPVGSMGQRVLQPIINQQVGNVLQALEAEVMAAKAAPG